MNEYASLACAVGFAFACASLFCLFMSRHHRKLADKSYRANGFTDAQRDAIRARYGFRVNWFGGISWIPPE